MRRWSRFNKQELHAHAFILFYHERKAHLADAVHGKGGGGGAFRINKLNCTKLSMRCISISKKTAYLADAVHGKGGGGASAQPHHHAALHILHRLPGRLQLMRM